MMRSKFHNWRKNCQMLASGHFTMFCALGFIESALMLVSVT